MSLRTSDELISVARRFMDAMNQRDFATVRNFFLRSEHFRYVGSDEHEWWQGIDPIDAFERHQNEMPNYRIEIDEVEAYETESVGWAALRTTTTFEGYASRSLRWTFVFVLDGGFWRIAQIHDSFAVPNPEVMGIEMTKSLEELLEAIGGDEIRGSGRQGTVTLVFTDIEDSTPLASIHGDARWAEIIEDHDATIRAIVERAGGSVIKTLGDGAMLAFESVRDAARSAVAIQQEFANRTEEPRLRVRIGIHVGDAVSSAGDYLGAAVNKAARVAASAKGGQVMVSSAARALLEDDDDFEFTESFSVQLKGIEGSHKIAELISAPSSGD